MYNLLFRHLRRIIFLEVFLDSELFTLLVFDIQLEAVVRIERHHPADSINYESSEGI